MQVEYLLQTLCSELKLGTVPQKDGKGLYPLTIGSSPQIFVKEGNFGISFQATILPAPAQGNKEALLIYLMEGNLLGQGTGGARIGLDSSEKFFTLTFLLSPDSPYKVFYEGLEDFLNYIDFWQEEIPSFLATLL